jgi:hypothetical protein
VGEDAGEAAGEGKGPGLPKTDGRGPLLPEGKGGLAGAGGPNPNAKPGGIPTPGGRVKGRAGNPWPPANEMQASRLTAKWIARPMVASRMAATVALPSPLHPALPDLQLYRCRLLRMCLSHFCIRSTSAAWLDLLKTLSTCCVKSYISGM